MSGIIKATVNIDGRTGAHSVYGIYDLSGILNKGCIALGYECKVIETSEMIKHNDDVYWQYSATIDIQQKG